MKKTIIEENKEGLKEVGREYVNLYFQMGNFDEAEFVDCRLTGVEFEGVWINETLFKQCVFNEILFYAVQAYGAIFQYSKFSKVKFQGCNLTNCNFSKCTFDEVAFEADNIGSVTDISGACFKGIDLSKVTFTNVEYDSQTVFPRDFNPETIEGLVLIEE